MTKMANVYDIMEHGACPDGRTDNSGVLAGVCRHIADEGGGTILIPEGEFLTGPLDLEDNTRLLLEKGAVLKFVDDPGRYSPVETRWEGIVCYAMHPLIFAKNARNIVIEGEGRIDGNGFSWWKTHRAKKAARQSGPETDIERRLAALNRFDSRQPSGGGGRETQFLRPPLVQFLSCRKVRIEGVSFVNSPFWTIHPVFSQDIVIRDISILNPPDAPNTDGIDIDSCSDVSIYGAVVDVGDDCIALKAGSGERGLSEGKATRNVRVSGCTFLSGHGGVVIGSETAGGIENVEVTNCRFLGSDRGIRVKSRRGRAGLIQNLVFRNLVMDNVLAPLAINMFYNCGAPPEEADRLFSTEAAEPTQLTPKARNILVSNLAATRCRACAGFVAGLPEAKIDALRLENCSIGMAATGLADVGMSEMYQGLPPVHGRGIRIVNANVTLADVRVENCEGPAVIADSGTDIRRL